MFFTYRYLALENQRKEVQDFLGFELKIPAYAAVSTEKTFVAPQWQYACRFCDGEGRLTCLLKHEDSAFAAEGDEKIPGVPESFGSDEQWCLLFDGAPIAPFKGFPWNFTLTFCDKQEQPVTIVTAKRLETEGAVHMSWQLEKLTFDASGKPLWTTTEKEFRWEI